MTPYDPEQHRGAPHEPPGDDPLPDGARPDESSPLLCFCRRVREETIRTAILDGHTELEDLIEHTGAATGCGTCRFELAAFLKGVLSEPRSGKDSGNASRHLLLALGFVALFLSTFVIAWNLDLGRASRTQEPELSPSSGTADPERAADRNRVESGPTSDRSAGAMGARSLSVVDVFGQPLPDARIEWLRELLEPEPVSLDSNGTATRPYTNEASFLLVRHPEFSPAVVPTTAHGPDRVVLTSRPGLRIRIVDATSERGVPRAQVRWTPQRIDARLGNELALEEAGTLTWRADSDADGYAVLRGLPDCPGRIRVESPGHRTTEVDLDPRDEGGSTPPTIRLAPGRSLRAMLIDSNGDPLPWWVYATSRDGGATCSASANYDGSLRLRGLASGPFDAVAGGYVSAPLTQRFDESRRLMVFQTPPFRTFEISVVDTGGLRLSSARIWPLGRGFWNEASDGAGSFAIDAYPVGPLWLQGEAPGHVRKTVEVHPETRSPIELRLDSAPTVLGRIIDAKGDAIPGAVVELVHPDGRSPVSRFKRKHQTGRSATFAIDFDLEEGRGRLRVEAPNRPSIFTEVVERTDPSAPIDLGSIRIPPAATITLTIADSNRDSGLPELRPAEPGTLPAAPLRRNSDGAFESGPLAPGEYLLVMIPPPLIERSPTVHPVRLVPGRHTELRLTHDAATETDRVEEVQPTTAEDDR